MGMNYEELAEQSQQNNNGDCVTSAVGSIGTVIHRVYNQPHTFLDESIDVRHGWYNPTYTNSYLIPHPKESDDNYNIRKSASIYKAFLKQIVNTIVEPLFKNSFKFDVKLNQLAFGIAAENFNKKFNIKLFTMEAMKSFYLHDLLYTIVEPQSADSKELNDELPKIYNVKIENIRSDTKLNNNDMDLFTEIVYRMDKVYIDKDKCINVPYYTITEYKQNIFTTRTELYTDGDKYYSGDDKPKDGKLNRLAIDDITIKDYYYETLPIIEYKSKINTTRETTPEMHDLAIACWNLYNDSSLYKELIRKGPFPMMTIQATGELPPISIGVNNAFVYQPDMDAPKYLEVKTELHAELRAAMGESKQEIYKLFLQGLQTDETKFTSEDSNEISESLFFNKVNFLSEYLIDYTIKLFSNVIYVMLDGKATIETVTELSKQIEMSFDFDFDMNREKNDIDFYNLLAELTSAGENQVIRNKLIETIAEKIELTDKPLQE